jgi:hypothetical protein
MTEAIVDVAHEARLRRWRIGDQPVAEGWRTERDDGAIVVGAGRPVRLATLDAQAGRLEHATRRATLEAGVETVLPLTPSDDRPFGERAQALRDAAPDLVVVPLAEREGAERLALLAEALRYGCAPQQPRPRVLIASDDPAAVARAATLLSPFEIEVLPDVRTDVGRARLVRRLRDARREPGVLRDEALETLARAVARAQDAPALVVDVSGSSTSLVRADAAGTLHAVHARPLGVGRAADRVVIRAGLERVRRWIPWSVDPPTLLERVFNRSRWPDAAPTHREAIALEIALAHEAVAHALADAASAGIADRMRTVRAVLVTGRLADLSSDAPAVLVAVDALGLAEPTSIARDDAEVLVATAGAAVSMGVIEGLAPAIAERAVALAAAVPVDPRRRGSVRILSGTEVRDEPVEGGALFVVTVRGDVDVAGPGVEPARLAAGSLGVIVDSRRRPLVLPVRDAERVPTVAGWYGVIGAMPA